MRFELTTFSLARRRSTTELRPHKTGDEAKVGAEGFEPPSSWSRSTRATGLRYAPVEKRGGRKRTRTSDLYDVNVAL